MERRFLSLYTEYRLTLSVDWAMLTLRRYREDGDGRELEVDWHVGPISSELIVLTFSNSTTLRALELLYALVIFLMAIGTVQFQIIFFFYFLSQFSLSI